MNRLTQFIIINSDEGFFVAEVPVPLTVHGPAHETVEQAMEARDSLLAALGEDK